MSTLIFFVDVQGNNVRTQGTTRDGNMTLHEAGLSHTDLSNKEEIIEYFTERNPDKNVTVFFETEPTQTYDIFFDDAENSNNKGFAISLEDARSYIESYNGTDESYFADYRGGTVSIFCNETRKTVYSERVKAIKKDILDAMKTLIKDGESLTTETFTGQNPEAFAEFAQVNGFEIDEVVDVWKENEDELTLFAETH